MARTVFPFLCLLVLGIPLTAATQEDTKPPRRTPPPNQAPPRSDQTGPDGSLKDAQQQGGGSSSKDLPVDLSPPADDDKNHPESSTAVHEAEDAAGLYEGDEIGGVQEFRPWNPHKAEKDVEVGDFYFKRKNYRAALDRYREALYYKYNDAVATFRLGVCQEKLGDAGEARKAYEAYLKILPEGPFAGEAHQALDRLKAQSPPEKAAPGGDRSQR
jgi:tetratricopeptide (TPR) repeat protein